MICLSDIYDRVFEALKDSILKIEYRFRDVYNGYFKSQKAKKYINRARYGYKKVYHNIAPKEVSKVKNYVIIDGRKIYNTRSRLRANKRDVVR